MGPMSIMPQLSTGAVPGAAGLKSLHAPGEASCPTAPGATNPTQPGAASGQNGGANGGLPESTTQLMSQIMLMMATILTAIAALLQQQGSKQSGGQQSGEQSGGRNINPAGRSSGGSGRPGGLQRTNNTGGGSARPGSTPGNSNGSTSPTGRPASTGSGNQTGGPTSTGGSPATGSTSPTSATGSPNPTSAAETPPAGEASGGGASNGFSKDWPVSPEFKAKALEVANRLGMNPDHLMAVMSFESGFSPSRRNGAGSGATGLIQFMPETAKGLGTSTDALAQMSDVEQLDYVEKYLSPYAGKMNTLEDAYMAVFTPAAVGKGADHVLYSSGAAYSQNSGLDTNDDHQITVGEAAGKVREHLA